MSERGESRSCGSVSQAGKYPAPCGFGSREPRALVRSSASRAVAVTARTKGAGPTSAGSAVGPATEAAAAAGTDSAGTDSAGAESAGRPAVASAATSRGRRAGGATRSASAAPGWPTYSRARRSCGSCATAPSRPVRLIASFLRVAGGQACRVMATWSSSVLHATPVRATPVRATRVRATRCGRPGYGQPGAGGLVRATRRARVQVRTRVARLVYGPGAEFAAVGT